MVTECDWHTSKAVATSVKTSGSELRLDFVTDGEPCHHPLHTHREYFVKHVFKIQLAMMYFSKANPAPPKGSTRFNWELHNTATGSVYAHGFNLEDCGIINETVEVTDYCVGDTFQFHMWLQSGKFETASAELIVDTAYSVLIAPDANSVNSGCWAIAK